ncbi:LysM peptidoglycan-binding domain-containing protein [Acinetobacter indicus]|uniref:LysM peptidoglycan-binding domain-containing protein n=1 Tax=Acinetobacter indicus TaxID=756892 RepID=UPI000CEC95EB|nr:LysM domain-containing protein [Acinetobacter indicus]
MKFTIVFKDKAGNDVDRLTYRVSMQVAKGKPKEILVSSISKEGKGKGATIVGLERLVFEVKGFPTPYDDWTEIGYFSYNKRMNKNEIRTIQVNIPSLIINTYTFPKQNMAGTYERRAKVMNKNLDKKVYLYPSVIKHSVKSGENLEKISKQHGVTIDHIVKRNKGLNINSLEIGQTLIIKDEIDAKRQELKDHRKYREYIKEKFEVSKNNSKVIVKIEKDPKGTQLMYLNLSGAIAAVIGGGVSVQVGVARTPSGNVSGSVKMTP